MNEHNASRHQRHARMAIQSTVLISCGPSSWTSEIENLSATGALLVRPEDWTGRIGDRCVLDMLIDDDLHVNLEATIVRITPEHLGFAYSHIPADRESALWNLLGRYADHVDGPR
ncbi:PilZ domain-containing protein [Dokdonella sp. MW10]|uniref:PilZ domain-containing protein n=1 Tax=Dokdonella sp. MW10 TaxID=2992926 RepID=UPI003F81C341